MNIAVYCSSRDGLPQHIEDIAVALGQWLGKNGHTLVYGGVHAGLMHTVAQAAHDSGARVVGVVPECFKQRIDEVVDEPVYTQNLNDRKAEMYSRSDHFVVLPGGIGTIDEWVATLSQITVDQSPRRIVVMNLDGMYDHTVKQLEASSKSLFARVGNMLDISIITTTSQQMIEALETL
mgnify:CR=1 FL=1